MSISNYAQLQTAIASFLRRSDLTANIPDFISLAEAQISRRLQVRRMTVRATATVNAEFIAVPTDFAGVRSFKLDNGSEPLNLLSADAMADLKDTNGWAGQPGQPTSYALVGDSFEFAPVPNASFTARLTYYGRVPALATFSPTNWLLTMWPDIYLYGALMQSAPFLADDERIAVWGALFTSALKDAEDYDKREASGGRLSMQRTFTP